MSSGRIIQDVESARGRERANARVLALLLGLGMSACASSQNRTATVPQQPSGQAIVQRPLNPADVEFMTGMIHHHAQAVLIAGWAPTHGAGAAVRRLAERIVVAQRDEITIMQNWLHDRGLPAEDATAAGMKMKVGGMEHVMLMPGMLSDEQLKQLDAARGAEFDRLFLTFMIQHHRGALTMVDKLLKSYGGAQDEVVFRFSSDVVADQTTEIDRMQQMLAQMESAR